MKTYGFTLEYAGNIIRVSGYSSSFEARKRVYEMAIRDGYVIGPVRANWWQFWRPVELPEGYAEALIELGFEQ